MKNSLLAFVVVASLAGCGGSTSSTETATHDEQSGGETHHDEHGWSASLTAMHDVLAPCWHAEPGATRAALACTNASELDARAQAVAADATPEGQDADGWSAATTQLTSATAALVAECSASGPAAEERLGAIHDAFHVLIER